MTKQSPPLAMDMLISHAKDAPRLEAHGFVDRCLHERSLLAVDLLDAFDPRKRDLIGSDTHCGPVLLVQFMDSQSAIPCKIDENKPVARDFGHEGAGNLP